ncbi:MAG: hypothetical protein JWP69_1376 [Flaviaesturariibacter sp.]|nr:hypothetical protein [Flaviaesturariibacter sp.]
MNRNFTNDELEDFLKRNSDRLQMRPSDKVWKGISDNLNQRRRKFGWLAGSFLLVTSLVGSFLSQNTVRLAKASSTGLEQKQSSQMAGNSAEKARTAESISSVQTNMSSSISTNAIAKNTIASTTNNAKGNPLKVAYKKEAIQFNSASSDADAVTEAPVQANTFEPSIIDSDAEAVETPAPNTDLRSIPTEELTIESVTNLYQRLQKKNKLSFQFFFTPTVSYRKLTENKPYLAAIPQSAAAPNYAALYDIDDAVTHKPNIGLELGVAAKYPIASNMRLQGGLQFNMSRYDIKAFINHSYQPATLANNSGGNALRPTPYTNFSGAKSDWLQNIYFQVSAPVGVEVKFGNNQKTQFGIATTVQPTYMLGDRVYLISSDYKTYVEVPWLMRRWNVNTALETFVSYSTGKLDWQVGPQVRYQLLSSFEGSYPVKEHLFDFGLKVGVSLNKKSTTSDSKQ